MPRTICAFFFLLTSFSLALAQQAGATLTRASATPLITAGSSEGRVRFAAPGTVVQIHLQVYADTAQMLFDATSKGSVLDWTVQDSSGERLPTGAYLCVVTIKSLGGRLGQRIGEVFVQEHRTEVRAIDPMRLTMAQQQEIGPVEDDAAILVLKEDEPDPATVIAHNGEEGQIVRGRGALSFRLGDFFRGKDVEQMRLTPDGNLGIGVANPQAKLDVAGAIRASQGIIFPDGSIQFSAARKTFGTPSHKVSHSQQDLAQGGEPGPAIAGSGTTGQLPKWLDGPSGVLGDSVITELNGSIGINGAPNPIYKLDVTGHNRFRGSNVSFYLTGVKPGGNEWLFQTVDADGRLRVFDNTKGAERLRITQSGNVGIGDVTPSFRLHVVDPSNAGLRVQTNALGGSVASFGGFGDFLVDAVNVVGGRLSVKENGNVGIGIPNPEFKLDVLSENSSGIRSETTAAFGVLGISHASGLITSGVFGASAAGRGVSGSTDTGVAVQAYVTANQPGIFMAGSIFNGPRKFHITNDGTYIAGSDFAEALPASKDKADYAPGDVLVLSGEAPGTVEKASRPYDRRVAGVYSTRPGVLGADKQGTTRVDPNDLPVAILGIVPTKVSTENGPVRAGDLLTTSSTPGYAMKASPVRVGRAKVYRTGSILGKALEPLKEGKGVIKVLVTLR